METITNSKYKIQHIRHLTDSTYIIRMDRGGMKFKAGQNLNLGIAGDVEKRDYSIYSGEKDDYLEVLVKEVEDGLVSKQMKSLKPGDKLDVDGPFGFFTLKTEELDSKKYLFIASGTGIAPFHSIAQTHPNLNFKLIHGVRYANETYKKEHYSSDRYVSCVTKDDSGDFKGRVTDYLKANPVDKNTLCYLCGNVNMIYDAFDVLKEQGVPSGNLHAEVYF
jgi:ferredoxin--NADP+ reductase/benzoate/toluate 1,2-dioxygenase reductase subunit